MDTLESFANRLEEAAACREDVTLFGVDYMAVPVDEDGIPWHLGDEMLMDGEVCEVVGIGDGIVLYAFEDGVEWTRAAYNRHHHKRGVEDVLREFTDAILDWAGKSGTVAEVGTWSDVAAKYVERLRLAEDDRD